MTFFLAFDHRDNFLPRASPAQIREGKQLVYQGLERAVQQGVQNAGIIVDLPDILMRAQQQGYITAYPLEVPGQHFLRLQEGWERRVTELQPDYAKVLIRYNPACHSQENAAQAELLAKTKEGLGKTKLLCEVLIPATVEQLAHAGSPEVYGYYLRPALQLQAIRDLQRYGVQPAVWKIEGSFGANVQQLAQEIGTAEIIILGAGEKPDKINSFLQLAAREEKCTGFAIGRTIFQKPLEAYLCGQSLRQQTIDTIAQNYLSFCQAWQEARKQVTADRAQTL